MIKLADIAQSFQVREDDFSYQISSLMDDRFWFRLEKQPSDKDVITDYFIGEIDETLAGPLLTECFNKLKLNPKKMIIFKDILSSNHDQQDLTQAATDAYKRYSTYGREMLSQYGYQNVQTYLNKIGTKYNVDIIVL